MCGIAAAFAYNEAASSVDRDEVTTMRDHMASRGPDGVGEWFSPDGRVGLGHRRLSIIDLSPTGAQPMFSADKSLAIIFNGEIYNYRALRTKLEKNGRLFVSQSDTEVLLHLYEEHAEGMLDQVRGMYAFAIWDGRKRCLFLARDPFGIKPLYYSDDGQTIRVASLVGALRQSRQIDTSVDPAGHVAFFLWGSVPDPYTLYRGISALPAGHTMSIFEGGERRTRSFCFIPDILRAAEAEVDHHTISVADSRDLLYQALRDSTEHHLVADVPVGIFLSAGLDSSTITGLASESHRNIRTVTLGFAEYRGTEDDETQFAEVIAREYGTNHQTLWIARKDFEAETENLFKAMDRPSIDGVNTYFVSLAAKRTGLKVALSGLGGDELFAGYPSFHDVPRLVGTVRHMPILGRLGRMLRVVSSEMLRRFTSPKYSGIFEYGSSYPAAYLLRRSLFMPWELPEILDPDIVREGWRRLGTLAQLGHVCDSLDSARLKVSALELCWYMRHQLLRDADWSGMAHSLEIRVPLVDVDLLRVVAPLLASDAPPTKRDMARAPTSPLPNSVLNRPKTGFSVPVREWLIRNPKFDRLSGSNRGLRGWAKQVYARFPNPQWADESRRLKGRRKKQDRTASDLKKRQAPSRVLVFRIGQLGDTIVALPAMWTVRRHFPNSHIALLCDQHPGKKYVLASDLLPGAGIFDEFLSYPVTGTGYILRPGRMATLLAGIRRRRFDTLIYLAPSSRTAEQIERDRRFFVLAGIKHFIGLRGFPALPAKQPGKPLEETLPESQLLLNRLAASDLPVVAGDDHDFDLRLSENEEEQVSFWLRTLQPDGSRPWLAVGPGSKMPAKRWPLERFREVVDQLIAEFDIWPVVFGGREDKVIGDQLVENWGRGYNAAGALGLRAAAAAIKRCALFLGNDTGTMHLAAAVGAPCVAIFSSRERPGLWFPQGEGHRVFRSQIECEGCGLIECLERDIECLRKIGSDEVFEACASALRVGNQRSLFVSQQCR